MENSIFEVLKFQSVQINEKPYPDFSIILSHDKICRRPESTKRQQPLLEEFSRTSRGKFELEYDPADALKSYRNSLKSGFWTHVRLKIV